MKTQNRTFTTTYIGDDIPKQNLFKGGTIHVLINMDEVKQMYWVTDLKSLIVETRRIINIYRTKGTIY